MAHDFASAVDDRVFALRARWLLEDHPWAAQALADSERGRGADGVDELRIRVDDPAANEAGIRAIADVLGLEPVPAVNRSADVRGHEDVQASLRLVAIGALDGSGVDDDRGSL